MGYWEEHGKSSDWRTPPMSSRCSASCSTSTVAAPTDEPMYVPALHCISERSLETPWSGFVWMNPPFGGRNAIAPWLDKFFGHGNGIALTPDRTSCPWWQRAAAKADALLFVAGKIRFIRPDGTTGTGRRRHDTVRGWCAGDARAAQGSRRRSRNLARQKSILGQPASDQGAQRRVALGDRDRLNSPSIGSSSR